MANRSIFLFVLILTLTLASTVLHSSNFVLAQSVALPTIEWSKTYTYGTFCGIEAMTATVDGGYVLGGYVVELGIPGQTTSNSWLLKLDSSGNKVWEQGLSDAYLNLGQVTSIIQANDSGYIFICADLVKTDALGNVQWKHSYNNVSLRTIIKTSDNEYAMSGSLHGGGFWLAKINSKGDTKWVQTYGGSNDELAGSLVQTVDSGYVIAGSTYSHVTDTWDMWLVKTDSSGTMLWNRTYGTPKDDQGTGVIQAEDNDYIIAGIVDQTLCLVKFDSTGAIVWNQTYNQVNETSVHSIIKTNDGSYAVAVESGITKIEASGKIQWFLPYDGTYAVIQNGNDYVLAGSRSITSPGEGWIASTTAPSVTTPSPTPVPELSWSAILPMFAVTLTIALVIRRRKAANVQKP